VILKLTVRQKDTLCCSAGLTDAIGEIYRTFPGWVHLILIRKVTDIAAVGIASKNEPERFEKAFTDVPK
jgi:hypothetical protein